MKIRIDKSKNTGTWFVTRYIWCREFDSFKAAWRDIFGFDPY